MNKFLLTIGAVALVASSATAQPRIPGGKQDAAVRHASPVEAGVTPATANQSSKTNAGTVYLSEDFSTNPFAAGGWTNGGPTGHNWEWRNPANSIGAYDNNGNAITVTNSTWIGSRGSCASYVAPVTATSVPFGQVINSPTRTNGFVIFDSNYLDDPDDVCDGNATTNTAEAPHFGKLISPAIDMTGSTSAELVFHQAYRAFQDSVYVLFSYNGGLTWGDTVRINPNIAVNQTLPNVPSQTIQKIKIPAAASGQTDFHVMFFWSGDFYMWQIDDIEVREKSLNDLGLNTQITLGPVDLDANGNPVARYGNYGMVPNEQIGQGMFFQANLENKGKVAQPNTRLRLRISNRDNNATVLTDSIATATNPFPVAAFDTLAFGPILATAPIGRWNSTITAVSDSVDEDPNDNVFSRPFTLTDTVYGVDSDTLYSFTTAVGSNNFGNEPGFEVLNYFELVQQDTLTSVTVRFTTGTPGMSYQIVVLQPDPTAFYTGPRTELFTSDNLVWTANSTAWQTIDFFGNGPGTPGAVATQDRVFAPGEYLIGVRMFPNAATDNIAVRDDLSYELPPAASNIFIPSDNRMYSNGNAFAIRANFGNHRRFSVAETKGVVAGVSLFPNPTNTGSTTLEYELTAASEVSITVRDLAGRTVTSMNEGVRSVGTSRAQINTAAMASGIYTYELNTANGRATGKLIVNNN